jgi:serine/threonine-protein kinase
VSLAPGTTLGVYKVTASLGAGGMGEVYRARDTKLDREVALKILPEIFAADPDRLARFEREAKTLAALNHPHIAQIYGVEESTDVRALVMELVDGQTVAERIAEEAVPVDEALTVARQIAAALEAAHEQGIIHRDLKPANIKIRPDGTVKVLDFGLAKLAALNETPGTTEESPGHGLTMSPTMTNAVMTGAGLILGTAAYMSPEQARGRTADKRSDIWAFGVVLFEMLSGRRLFDGEDVSETLAFVLTKSPDWALLPAALPQSVSALLRRCLERDRRRRVADISTASFVLDAALSATATDAEPDARPGGHRHVQSQIDAAVTAARRDVIRWRLLPVAAALLVAAGLVGLGVWKFKSAVAPPPTVRFSLTPADGQAIATARQAVAISPDGTRIAYNIGGRLYVRRLSEFDARPVAGAEANVQSPVFSPDGDSIAFVTSSDSTVRRVPVAGGGPVTICAAINPVDLTWDSSGIVFVDSQASSTAAPTSGIFRCASTGGQPEPLLVSKNNDEFWQGPQLLPGGRSVLFTIIRRSDPNVDQGEIVVQSLTTGQRKPLVRGSDARYLPTGHLLWTQFGRMLAVAFNPEREEVQGGPVAVVEGVRRSLASGSAQLVTSATGVLAYVPGPVGSGTGNSRVAIADRTGAVTPLPIEPGPYADVRASRDGAQLAISSDNGKEAFISIYQVAGTSAMRRLTFGDHSRFPIWSPDGDLIAYQSDREGNLAIFVQRADGTGSPRRLTTPGQGDAHVPESWSPDGKHISFSVIKGASFALWTLPVDDGNATPFGNVQSINPLGSVFSRDGQWLAYYSNAGVADSTTRGIWVHRFPMGERYIVPHIDVDFQPVWSLDGPELFYVPSAASGNMAVVNVTAKSGISFGPAQTFPARVTGGRIGTQPRAYDVLPGNKFVGLISGSVDKPVATSAPSIHVVLNWFEELKARVPAR